jgi:thiol-disulfide isomerase/thioredoxin
MGHFKRNYHGYFAVFSLVYAIGFYAYIIFSARFFPSYFYLLFVLAYLSNILLKLTGHVYDPKRQWLHLAILNAFPLLVSSLMPISDILTHVIAIAMGITCGTVMRQPYKVAVRIIIVLITTAYIFVMPKHVGALTSNFRSLPKIDEGAVIGKHIDYKHLKPIGNVMGSIEADIIVAEHWATWCKPCLALLPTFDSVSNHYANNNRVSFIAVNAGGIRDTEDKVLNFVQTKPYKLSFYMDSPNKTLDSLKIIYLPCTVISHEGKVAKVLIGGDSDSYYNEIQSTVDSLLHVQ